MKDKFIKSTIILIIGGLITKILSLVIRIITTRYIGTYGIGLFMMIMPTFSLFITICTLSLPLAISKLISENKRNNKKIIFGITPFAIIFDIFIMVILIIISPFISNNLLSNSDLYYPILCISFTLPFITLSCIARGYFFGKERMLPHTISNLFEQIVRIIITILITPYLLKYGIIVTICGLVLYNVISEIASILILFLFLPKKVTIKKSDIVIDPHDMKDLMSISIPTTAGRLISSISMFLEPIIITFVLLKLGYDNNYIIHEYGIITGYVIPMVTLPCFLSSAISNALLPTLTKLNELKDYKGIKRKIKQAIIFSLFIGGCCSIVLILFPSEIMNLIFNESLGIDYLIFATFIFLISYIGGPLSTALQAMNKSKNVMYSNLFSSVIKNVILFILLFLDINMYALLIAYLFQFLFITIYQYLVIKQDLSKI